jgi:hypothetical protein
MNKPENQPKETLEKWHKDPNNWNTDYYNKEDKRLLAKDKNGWMDWPLILLMQNRLCFFYCNDGFSFCNAFIVLKKA